MAISTPKILAPAGAGRARANAQGRGDHEAGSEESIGRRPSDGGDKYDGTAAGAIRTAKLPSGVEVQTRR